MIEVEGSTKKFRVLLGVSPEEIEKWRNDRKKNFPTAENTMKKNEQKEELRMAGGLIIDKRKKRKRDDGESNKKVKVKNTDGVSANNTSNAGSKDDIGTVDGVDGSKGDKNDDGNEDGKEKDKDENDEENEEREDRKGDDGKPRKRPCVFFVKGTCKQGDLCTYSHDFEIKVCNFFVRSGRCTRGNRCTFAHDKEQRLKFIEEGTNSTEKRQNKNQEGKEGKERKEGEKDIGHSNLKKARNVPVREELNDADLRARAAKKKGQLFLPKPFSGGSRGTLLRNLLLHEVEEEENVLLQCLRLLVTHNFLQPLPPIETIPPDMADSPV